VGKRKEFITEADSHWRSPYCKKLGRAVSKAQLAERILSQLTNNIKQSK
jgi:hypothetical protein